jgi:hypothetical protein
MKKRTISRSMQCRNLNQKRLRSFKTWTRIAELKHCRRSKQALTKMKRTMPALKISFMTLMMKSSQLKDPISKLQSSWGSVQYRGAKNSSTLLLETLKRKSLRK